MFLPGESPYRASIELGYAGMARFLSQHPNPWGWDPLVYCGLPVRNLYVPALPYTAAVTTWIAGVSPEIAWRWWTAVFCCLTPVSVFVFVYYFTRNRWWALLAGAAVLLFSPAYGLFHAVDKDRGITLLPWRVQVFAKYGEGPHNTGLALLPLALAALAACARRRGFGSLFLASILLAAVVLTNWVAGLALGFSAILLLLCGGLLEGFAWKRAVTAGVLAYLLSLFWLTPSFVSTIAGNWPRDAFEYRMNSGELWMLAGLAATVCAGLAWIRWQRFPFYVSYVSLCACFFGWIACGYYQRGIDTFPESRRYALEFELFFLLAIVEWMRLGWQSKNRIQRLCVAGGAAALLWAGLPQAWLYVTDGWEKWAPVPSRETAEWRITEWLSAHPPTGRILASGGLRFRMNAWADLPQVSGTFESGVRNLAPHSLYQKIRNQRQVDARDLDTLGVEYIVVHEQKSREFYRDFRHPKKFAALYPEVYRSGGDVVYQTPVSGLADGLRCEWKSMNELVLTGTSGREPPLVRINYDPGWKADMEGRRVPVLKDETGFLRLAVPAGSPVSVRLQYGAGAEPMICAGVSLAAWVFAGLRLLRRQRSVS